MAVYDDEKQSVDTGSAADEELRRLTGISKDEEGAMDREAHSGAAADIAEREGLFNKSGDDDDEAYGPSAADTIKEKLGKGYTDDGSGKRSKRRQGGISSKLKKKLAIAGAAAGASAIGGAIVFFALLPLKIENVISNLEKRYGAATHQALGKESNHLLKGYISKYLIPALSTKRCKTTVDPTCVVTVAGDGPIKQMYKAWRNERFEQKLADYGLTFGRSGNTYYIKIDGSTTEFKGKNSEQKLVNWVNDPNTTSGKKSDVERRLSQFLKEKTYWERIYYRFRLAPFVNKKIGTRHCINACSKVNEFRDSIADKKWAAKAYVLERVMTPLSQNYSFILQCIMVGEAECNVDKLKQAEPGDTTPETEGESHIRSSLRAAAARFLVDDPDRLEKLVKEARKLEGDGFNKYLVRKMVEKLVTSAGKDGAKAGTLAADAVDPITWVLLAARLAALGRSIGPIVQYLSYAANTAAAAQLFTAYQTVASEMKSGEIDGTQLGSFANALDTSLDTSDLNSMDAAASQLKKIDSDVQPSSSTQTPYYQAIMGTGSSTGTSTASVFSSFVSGSAYADSGINDTGYVCDGGDPVQSGELVCSEEKFDHGTTKVGSIIATVSNWYNAYLDAIPGMNFMLKVLNKINGVLDWTVEQLIHYIASPVGKGICYGISIVTPGGNPCTAAKNKITSAAQKALDILTDQILKNPFAKLSGGRLFDMLGGGASYVFNQSGQENLGAGYVSDTTSASIQTAYLNEQHREFEQRPLFARMFSTDTPYSLVSKVAVSMPSSLSIAGNNMVASIQQSPLSAVGKMFGSIFTFGHASAATPTQIANPFGIPQAAYTNKEIPTNPERFWNKNCVNGPLGKWDQSAPVGKQLDISEWLNVNQNDANTKTLRRIALYSSRDTVIQKARQLGMNVMQDPETGQAIYLHPNQCSLILASVQSAGGLADPTLLPEDSLTNNGASGGAGGNFRIATFNIFYSGGGSKGSGTVCHDVCRDWSARLDQSVKVIKDTNLDVVGLQEVTKEQWQALQNRLGSGYAIYPKPYGGIYPGGNSIVWRTDKFTLVEGKAIPARSVHNTSVKTPQIRLRDNTTGQEFYVINTHEPVDSGLDRYNSDLKWLDYIKGLSGSGLPIFFTGDFNASYMDDSGNPNKFLDHDPTKAIYCMISKQGILWDSYDASKNLTGECPTKRSPGRAGDHIFISRNVSVTKYGRVSYLVNGSDVHDTVWSDVVMPGGNQSSTQYKNSVYDGSAPDPGVIRGDDGTYHVFTTGGDQLTSTNMVNWKKVSSGWNLKGAPRADCNWAPDVAKVKSFYVLTYARIPNCSSVGGVSSSSTISYAVGTSAGGPFQYQGSITDMGYAIDPHIFVDDDGTIWLNFGGGVIYLVQLKMNGQTLRMVGSPKAIFSKTSSPTIENGWIQKNGNYYYLYYSQGHWNKSDGPPEYSTKIARAKSVTGPYKPTTYKTILSGNSTFWGPGGGSITKDNAGTEWFVYHAWHGGDRVLLIDPIRYSNGWPTIGSGTPSTTAQNGPFVNTGGN